MIQLIFLIACAAFGLCMGRLAGKLFNYPKYTTTAELRKFVRWEVPIIIISAILMVVIPVFKLAYL